MPRQHGGCFVVIRRAVGVKGFFVQRQRAVVLHFHAQVAQTADMGVPGARRCAEQHLFQAAVDAFDGGIAGQGITEIRIGGLGDGGGFQKTVHVVECRDQVL